MRILSSGFLAQDKMDSRNHGLFVGSLWSYRVLSLVLFMWRVVEVQLDLTQSCPTQAQLFASVKLWWRMQEYRACTKIHKYADARHFPFEITAFPADSSDNAAVQVLALVWVPEWEALQENEESEATFHQDLPMCRLLYIVPQRSSPWLSLL